MKDIKNLIAAIIFLFTLFATWKIAGIMSAIDMAKSLGFNKVTPEQLNELSPNEVALLVDAKDFIKELSALKRILDISIQSSGISIPVFFTSDKLNSS